MTAVRCDDDASHLKRAPRDIVAFAEKSLTLMYFWRKAPSEDSRIYGQSGQIASVVTTEQVRQHDTIPVNDTSAISLLLFGTR